MECWEDRQLRELGQLWPRSLVVLRGRCREGSPTPARSRYRPVLPAMAIPEPLASSDHRSRSPPPRRAQPLLHAPAQVVFLDVLGPDRDVDLAGGVALLGEAQLAEDVALAGVFRVDDDFLGQVRRHEGDSLAGTEHDVAG